MAKRKKIGGKKAARIANAAKPLPIAPPPEQVDMLERIDPLRELGAPVGKNVERLRAQKPTGPGRPAGSLNRRTVEMADYLLSRYKSPLEVLAQIAVSPIDELSASLGCTKLEALQEVRLAAIALKDHLHSKMPLAVDVTNRKVIHLVIGEIPGGDPNVGGGGVGLSEIIDLTATESPEESAA